jgi:hypothetical protein
MNRTIVIEGMILILISLVGIGEGFRLIYQKDLQAIPDVIGPGYYVLFISLALMVTGLLHLMFSRRKEPDAKRTPVRKEMRMKMFGMVAVLVLFIILIYGVGYLTASAIFFLLQFRIVGIKSWATNVVLTSIITGLYYVVFVHYCNMIFPPGIIWG